MIRNVGVALVSIVAVACQQSTAARYRSIGFIDNEPASRVINAPSVVTAGQSFDVTVSTYGNSCVSAAGADVSVDGLTARITPYDIIREDEGCLDYSAPYPRTVQVRFDQRGTATIRVHGRSYWNPEGVTVEHSVVVQ